MEERRCSAERGAILLVSVILLLAGMALGISMLMSNRMSARMVSRRKERLTSYYAAEGVLTWIAQEITDGRAPRYVRFPVMQAVQLGEGGTKGSVAVAPDTLVLVGAGTGIGGSADCCLFRYMRMTGEFDIAVMVDSLRGGRGGACAGLMVREDTAAGARYVFWGLSAGGEACVQVRDTTGSVASITENLSDLRGPLLVRVVRSKRAFVMYSGQHGVGWRVVDTVTVRMPDDVLVGLAVASGQSTDLCTVTVTTCTGWTTVDTIRGVGEYDVRYRLTRRSDGLFEVWAEAFRYGNGATDGAMSATMLAEYVGEGDGRRIAVPDNITGPVAARMQRPSRRWVGTRF